MGKVKKKELPILLIVLTSFIFSLTFISAGFGYNVESSGTDININIRDSATNITDMGDINSSMIPGGGEALIWDDNKKVWTSDSVASASDTNESTRVGNLVTSDCSGTDKVTGTYANGTVICATDQTGGGGSDGNASSICSTDEVLLGNGTCWSSSNFFDDTDTNTFYDQSLNTTDNVQFKNLTLSDTITFSLGEIIDNLVNSWIKITGNLRVTGNLEVQGNIISNGTANFTLQDLNNTGAGITDTNESTRVHNIVNTSCSGGVVEGWYENGTAICGTDDTGTGGKSTDGFYVYNDSANIYFNETQLNDTIDARDTDTDTNVSTVCSTNHVLLGNASCMNIDDISGSGILNNSVGNKLNLTHIYSKDWTNVTLTESQIKDLTHTTDTDTNVSTVCGGEETLLGNSSCMNSTLFEGTHTTIWDTTFNTSFDQRDADTTYSAGSNLSLIGTTFSLNISQLTQYLDTLYQAVGSYIGNNTGGWTLNFTRIYSKDWSNVTITESQIKDLAHTTDTNTFYDQDLNTTANVKFAKVNSTDWTNVTLTESQIKDLSHTTISSNIAYENETNTFTLDQNFSQNISIKTNNKLCINTACSSYLLNNGTDTILQG